MATTFSQASPEGASCSYEDEILKEFNFEEQDSNTPPFWIKRGRRVKHDSFSSVESSSSADSPLSESPKTDMPSVPKRDGKKRGRRPSHLDTEAKLERSRQSARECRARKKIRYQQLDDTVSSKEEEVSKLWHELDMVSVQVLAKLIVIFVHFVELLKFTFGYECYCFYRDVLRYFGESIDLSPFYNNSDNNNLENSIVFHCQKSICISGKLLR